MSSDDKLTTGSTVKLAGSESGSENVKIKPTSDLFLESPESGVENCLNLTDNVLEKGFDKKGIEQSNVSLNSYAHSIPPNEPVISLVKSTQQETLNDTSSSTLINDGKSTLTNVTDVSNTVIDLKQKTDIPLETCPDLLSVPNAALDVKNITDLSLDQDIASVTDCKVDSILVNLSPEANEPDVVNVEVNEPDAIITKAKEPDATFPEVNEPDAIITKAKEPDATFPEVKESIAISAEVKEPIVSSFDINALVSNSSDTIISAQVSIDKSLTTADEKVQISSLPISLESQIEPDASSELTFLEKFSDELSLKSEMARDFKLESYVLSTEFLNALEKIIKLENSDKNYSNSGKLKKKNSKMPKKKNTRNIVMSKKDEKNANVSNAKVTFHPLAQFRSIKRL